MSVASISLDLDNLWSYIKIHGDDGWRSFPSYLDRLAEIVIERLRWHDLRITIFVVGQDAALAKNREALAAFAAEGHEIGNHSFSHEPWFHRFSYDEAEREIARAEEHIEAATGHRPRGYRAPGFSLSADALHILARRGYLYDCSTFPTFIGPLARAYYFRRSRRLSEEERAERGRLYGTVGEGLRPLRPYAWDLSDGELLEIPVTTMPVLRLPFHMSYLIYLAGFSRSAFRAYLRAALAMCRWRRVEPSFLLHPLDFLGGDAVTELAFFPGMSTSTAAKLDLFDEAMEAILASFEPLTLRQHAERARRAEPLPRRRYDTDSRNPTEGTDADVQGEMRADI
ncbi:MAG: polysaccharide deacetylase family protein [Thermoanaerobaculia bacterium]